MKIYYPKAVDMFKYKLLYPWLKYMMRFDEIELTKIIKYYYSSPSSIAAHTQGALPEVPKGCLAYFPFNNPRIRKFFNIRMYGKKGYNSKFCSFATALNYNKRGAVEVPPTFIETSRDKYITNLTRVEDPPEVDYTVIREVIKTLPGYISFEDVCKASVQGLSIKSCSDSDKCEMEKVMEFIPNISIDLPLGDKYEGPCPQPFFAYSYVEDELVGKATLLNEPLKCRTITSINASETWSGKPFQVCQKRMLERDPNMLFGRSVTDEDIRKLAERSEAYWTERGYSRKDLLWVSGDYENATGNIHPNVSKEIDKIFFDEKVEDFSLPYFDKDILNGVYKTMAKVYEYVCTSEPAWTERHWISVNLVFKSMMENHLGPRVSQVRNTTWSGRRIMYKNQFVATQTYEQLMGDIKSFPVLCYLNAALWQSVCGSHTFVRTNELISHKQVVVEKVPSPCYVNGDDFLALAPKTFIDTWFDRALKFSFQVSKGKTYVSSFFAQINSRTFLVSPINGVTVCKIPYINLSLRLPKDKPIAGTINEITKDFPGLLKLALNHNKKTIMNCTKDGLVNLFIPEKLGGIGVIPPVNWDYKITYKQLCVVDYNLKQLKKTSLRRPIVINYQEFDKRGHSSTKKKGFYTGGLSSRIHQRYDFLSALSKPLPTRGVVLKVNPTFYFNFVKIVKKYGRNPITQVPYFEKIVRKICDGSEYQKNTTNVVGGKRLEIKKLIGGNQVSKLTSILGSISYDSKTHMNIDGLKEKLFFRTCIFRDCAGPMPDGFHQNAEAEFDALPSINQTTETTLQLYCKEAEDHADLILNLEKI